MLAKLSIISGFTTFTASVSWLVININQPNYGSRDTIEESQRIDNIQDLLTIIWVLEIGRASCRERV